MLIKLYSGFYILCNFYIKDIEFHLKKKKTKIILSKSLLKSYNFCTQKIFIKHYFELTRTLAAYILYILRYYAYETVV